MIGGLIAARAGFPEGDSIAALFVAVLVVTAAGRLIRRNVDVLMDRAPADAVEAARDKWFDAPDLEAEKAAVADMNRELWRHVTYVPTGFYKTYQAWRRNVSGVVGAPIPFFWGVTKT